MCKISMSFVKEAFYNAFRFVINIGFIFLFQMMFHTENALIVVTLSINFTILPNNKLHIRPGAMYCIVLLLYVSREIAAQSALLHPALAFLINSRFLVLLLALIGEPMEMKANISFLFCSVFSQSTCAPWAQFLARLVCVSFGAPLICSCVVLNWERKGIGRNGCTLKEQFQRNGMHRSYILRMSLRILLAMLVASILQLSRPLWISIVMMSLTRLEFSETLERIRHRFIDTLAGIILFSAFFQLLIPQRYVMLVIVLLGYIDFSLPRCKYKQIISAISTSNASLVILDTKTATENRLFCLVLGIVIVIVIYMLADAARKVQRIQHWGAHTVMADDHPKNRETAALFSASACTYGE